MKDYNNFYEEVDRVKKYSAHTSISNHPFYSDLNSNIKKYDLTSKKGLEIGSGTGALQEIIEDYTGIDVSKSVKKYYKKPYYVINDGEPYPFNNESFDFIFTNAVFEHIPNIDFALKETIRVLKKDGYLFFKPAWNCRTWAANGYTVRPYTDFNLYGKLIKFSIPFRNSKVARALYLFPGRVYYLLIYLIKKSFFTKKIKNKKLTPNYEHHWQSDGDAVNSIDPFSAILYFRANGLKILNYPTLFSAFFIKTGILIIKK